jgi:hypothetical protein
VGAGLVCELDREDPAVAAGDPALADRGPRGR